MSNNNGSNTATVAAIAIAAIVAVVVLTQTNDEPTVGEVIENTVDEATGNE